MVDRVSSFSQTSQLINSNLRLESEYATGQVQLSSGYKSETYAGISGDSQQILTLETEYDRISVQAENAQTALNRTEVMFDSMSSILTEAQGFLADINGAISGTISAEEVQSQAQTSMELTQASLNTEHEGRYIFSGSATKTAPVDIDDPTYGGAVIPSTADTNYYQGNDYIQSVEASDGYTIDYGVTADNAAFEQILRAYDLVRTTPNDQATLEEAYALMEQAIVDLSQLQARTSQDSTALNNAINESVDELNLIDNMITDLTAVDLAEVSVRLAELEAQIEASYSVTTDLLRLNITDFI